MNIIFLSFLLCGFAILNDLTLITPDTYLFLFGVAKPAHPKVTVYHYTTGAGFNKIIARTLRINVRGGDDCLMFFVVGDLGGTSTTELLGGGFNMFFSPLFGKDFQFD